MYKKYAALIVMLILLFCMNSQANALTINLSLNSTPINVGNTFTMDVIANNVFAGLGIDEVLAFGFDVANPNPSLVSFIGASVNSPFNSDLFPNTTVAGSVFPGIPNDGTNNTIQLATLTFQALQAGSNISLGIFSDMADFNEGLVYFSAGNMDITTSTNFNINAASTSIPEPGTIVLLGSGLVGFAFRRGFRKIGSKSTFV
jgi:hypothetical protein